MSAPLDSGVRRGAEVRCPGCIRFIPSDAACPHCFCGPVPPERYGAARELLKSGVDRFALAARTAALDPSQVEALAARYARQWGVALRLIEDARRIESRLVQRGFSLDMEDAWAAALPMDEVLLTERIAPFSPLPDSLAYLSNKAPDADLRNLAALAWVHEGTASQDARATVRYLLHQDGRMAVEAMLALTRWRNAFPVRLTPDERERIRLLALGVLDVPGIGARAAVAWTRVSREAPPSVVSAALHQGLYGTDLDVRFECALALRDEVEVAQALDSPDADTVTFVRRTLSGWGSPLLFPRLKREGNERFVQEVLRDLPFPPPEGALDALLTVSVRTVGSLADELLRLAKRQSFHAWGLENQQRWARWARSVLRDLPAETALHFFGWAATPGDTAEPPEEEETEAMWCFLEETVHAIERGAEKDRIACFKDFLFVHFLHHAGVDEQRRLNDWARDPYSGEALLEALVMFPSRREQARLPASGVEHAARLLMAVWEGPDQHLLVAPMSRVARQWSAYSGREVLVEAVWQRFQSHPFERGLLLAAFAGWRDRLWEKQREAEPDALVRFQAWWRLDPVGLYPHAEQLLAEVTLDVLPRRLRALWAAAEETVGTRPRTASLSVSKGAWALLHGVESEDPRHLQEMEAELAYFESRLPAFEQRVRTTPSPPEESNIHRDFLDDTHDALRMMRERRDRRRAHEEREREREIERQVAESRRRDQERRAEEERRAAEAREAARLVEHGKEQARALANARMLMTDLQPQVPARPLDREVLFPGTSLPTLLQYARMLKALQGGADVLKLFEVVGLTPATWATQANAWGQAMVGRPELAIRFSELLQAPWA
ncbi:hypothetical protein D7X74_02235 [Corallococcus sp. CA047B]|uniref:hypothetical protein n=1 Tax=Corallococcus sp. CA047B TaxID=2316729 RepID=UPI000EA06ACF|nr:hypothetical protein [Corallococcus sp. CA047B]RKH21047.1 hypothetical protein D7X74_02235 [Corallococcus sp. CA047B]